MKLIFAEQGSPKRELILQPLSFLGYLQGDFWYIKAIWRKKLRKKQLYLQTHPITLAKKWNPWSGHPHLSRNLPQTKRVPLSFSPNLCRRRRSLVTWWMTVAPLLLTLGFATSRKILLLKRPTHFLDLSIFKLETGEKGKLKSQIGEAYIIVHLRKLRKLTWMPKMMVWNKKSIYLYVKNFWGVLTYETV